MAQNLQKRIGTNHPRIAILTSVETRHRYFANSIRERFDTAVVVYARPSFTPQTIDDSELTPAERAVVAEHFAERSRQEERFFGRDSATIESGGDCTVLHLEPGLLNSAETVTTLRDRGVNTVVVFGTDLIKPPLLAPDAWTMINLHLGLSPYYRGTATNFYPLLNEEPEYVGATVHRLDAGIDSGPIYKHVRPPIVASDRPHTIGCKAIAAGISAMIEVLDTLSQGEELTAVPQWTEAKSRIYYRRDYHPRQVVELYQKWNNGMLSRILAEKRPAPRLINCKPAGPEGITARPESKRQVSACTK